MMDKRVLLRCDGSLEQGFRVTLEISDRDGPVFTEVSGALPAAIPLLQQVEKWQNQYRQSVGSTRISLDRIKVKTGRLAQIEACRDSSKNLQTMLKDWLSSLEFQPIEQRLREVLASSESVEILLKSTDVRLHRFPWHLWDFIERYPQAELLISTPSERVTAIKTSHPNTKVLAILGDREGIDIAADRQLLAALPNADVTFLVEPSRQQVSNSLWEQSWDILFFAGHSHTEQQHGQIQLNANESLTIEELRYGLRRAISHGLQLAIFNSCDGLGLAYDLEQLYIPQLIVMREPVPDRVAQAFLKRFLTHFAAGDPLHTSIRQAREYLQGLEGDFPCASWLPVMFQNSAVAQLTWKGRQNSQSQPLLGGTVPESQQPSRSSVPVDKKIRLRSLTWCAVTSLAFAGSIVGVRHFGVLQAWELAGFDQLMRLRPAETPDPRLLIVTVTEADVQAQARAKESRQGSLSDTSLNKLVEKLDAYQPAVIGLDIIHDYPVSKSYPKLSQYLRQNDRFVGACKVSDPEINSIGVAPPPELPPERIGFGDLLLDSDQVVRRNYLALTPPPSSPCAADYGFATQLALTYLIEKQVKFEFLDDNTWKIGNLTLSGLTPGAGGYKKFDALGHQILLNYRAAPTPMDVATQVTLGDVLAGKLSADAVQGRIVLIGTTAESFKDYSLTPYRTPRGGIQPIPGVVLQAQMVSQLLSAVLNNRPLIQIWPAWAEILWISTWSLLGGLLVGVLGRPLYIALGYTIAIPILIGLCLESFQTGYWIPVIPSSLALTGSVALSLLVDKRLKHPPT
jgi:CHASE2 domain-containing sensor protein